jgi:hypothetical protein
MTGRRILLVLALGLLPATSACDTDLLQDPLGTKPFPVIIGGDDAWVFYATNLGDVSFRLPGMAYDSVIPGFFGPSNVYRFSKRKPELIRPLTPAAPGVRSAITDGRHLVYVISSGDLLNPGGGAIVVEGLELLGPLTPRTIFEPEGEDGWGPPRYHHLALDSGRVAFAFGHYGEDITLIRIVDLYEDATREIEAEGYVLSLALRGNLLVHSADLEGQIQILLRDLVTGEVSLLAEDVRFLDSLVLLTQNSVIWSAREWSSEFSRVWIHDLPSGTQSVWADNVQGRLVGATDEFLITEEMIRYGPFPFNLEMKPDMIVVRRYDRDGNVRKLAEFRWTGLSGQTRVIGDRAVWVNPKRKIVLAPLDGSDRTIFEPF